MVSPVKFPPPKSNWLELWNRWDMASNSWSYIQPLRKCFPFWKQSLYWALRHIGFIPCPSSAQLSTRGGAWAMQSVSQDPISAVFWLSFDKGRQWKEIEWGGREKPGHFSSCVSAGGSFSAVNSPLRLQLLSSIAWQVHLVPPSIWWPSRQ